MGVKKIYFSPNCLAVNRCIQPLLEDHEPGCTAKISRWYHDHNNGGDCRQFTYNGCKKNDNHFETKDECDKECSDWHKSHCAGTPPLCT